MAIREMYEGINNSPMTSLVGEVTATATIINVQDATKLPDGPNLATLGTDENAEVIFYTEKMENSLMGVVRGYDGTVAQAWQGETEVYRAYTRADHGAFIESIRDLDTRKLNASDTGNDLRPVFAQAEERENIASGLALSLILGRIMKWLADLGGAAFAEIGTLIDDVAAGQHAGQHGQDGADAITPAMIGAATLSAYTITLPTSSWIETDGKQIQTITVTGATPGDFVYMPGPDLASKDAYAKAGVWLVEPTEAGQLTFTADKLPEADLTVNVVKMGW